MEPFVEYMLHPQCAPMSLSEPYLRSVVERAPWFTAARVLLAHVSGNPDPQLMLHQMTHPVSSYLLPNPLADQWEQPIISAPTPEQMGWAQGSNADKFPEETVHEVSKEAVSSNGYPDESVSCENVETPSETMAVIDRFLASPTGRIVADEHTPEGDLSREGAVEELDDDLATEELAEIYLSQGLQKRAVACYRKLSLLYPEKSVYFAEIIGRIEQETD